MTGFAENPVLVVFLALLVFFLMAAGVLVILWIAVPFSVFGTKGLLARLIEEQEKTNALLRELLRMRNSAQSVAEAVDDDERKKDNRPPDEPEEPKTGINEEVKTIDL